VYVQVLDVGCRDDRHHARQAAGGADVDGTDDGVGVDAAEHHGVQEAWQLHVVNERALSGE
jgi:hypothetical protein